MPPTEAVWGALRNGSWIGMVGMLDRKEIDLTAGGMLITNGRKPFVDFCLPTAELKECGPTELINVSLSCSGLVKRKDFKILSSVHPMSWQPLIMGCSGDHLLTYFFLQTKEY